MLLPVILGQGMEEPSGLRAFLLRTDGNIQRAPAAKVPGTFWVSLGHTRSFHDSQGLCPYAGCSTLTVLGQCTAAHKDA